MQLDQNSELIPDQEALSPRVESVALSGTDQGGGGSRGMSLNEEKVAELSEARAQHEAVMKIVKDELASKLNSFYILYYVVLLVVSAAIAARIFFLPGGEGWSYLVFFFIANGIYFSFLMVLSFSYELYRRVGWHAALSALALIFLLPKLQPYVTVTKSLIPAAVIAGAMLLLLGIGFLKRAPAGKRIMSALKRVRTHNLQEGRNRKEFVREAVEFLSKNETKARLLPGTVRRFARESAAGVVYSIRESNECRNKVEALQEFVKLHRLRDAIGRLAVVLGVAGALAYTVFPLTDVADAVTLVALRVLPVYGAALFIMEQFDEAREKAIGELERVIAPVVDSNARADIDPVNKGNHLGDKTL